jgi:hypothetical protein
MRIPISIRMVIEQSDERLGARVRQLRELDDAKRELNRQIKRLSQALATSGARAQDDLVFVPGGLETPADAGRTGILEIEQQKKIERTWKVVRKMAGDLSLSASKAVARRMRDLGVYRLSEVEARLERLHRRMTAVHNASHSMVNELGRTVNAAEPIPA